MTPADQGLEPIEWGDSAATSRVTEHGRVFAARRYDGPSSRDRAEEGHRRIDALAAAGIAVPWPAEVRAAGADASLLVRPWIDGDVGARVVGIPAKRADLAVAMGCLSSHISSLGPLGLALDTTWSDPHSLELAADRWLGRLEGEVDATSLAAARRAVEVVASAWDDRTGWSAGLAHGDFVPVNVVVRSDGSLVLLDLDDLCVAPRLLDVAWWGWVVRYHHPDAWRRTWPALVEAAGFSCSAVLQREAGAVARVRVIERSARAANARIRGMWLARFAETREW
jgi:Ser/Thr protein kinase RdoA (MazF antagonist)